MKSKQKWNYYLRDNTDGICIKPQLRQALQGSNHSRLEGGRAGEREGEGGREGEREAYNLLIMRHAAITTV